MLPLEIDQTSLIGVYLTTLKKKINLIVLDGSEKEFLEIGKYPEVDYRFLPNKNRVYRFISVLKKRNLIKLNRKKIINPFK